MKLMNESSPYPFIRIEEESDVSNVAQLLEGLTETDSVRSIAIQLNRSLLSDRLEQVLVHFGFNESEVEVSVVRDLSGSLSLDLSPLEGIQFKTFDEIGIGPFLVVSNGISSIRRLKTEDGLKNLQGQFFNPHLWMVGFMNGTPTCMVLGHIENGKGTCRFLGIVDTVRGKGLGRPLFEKALEMLKASGAVSYFDSTSAENKPMLSIFAKSGCQVKSEILTYISGEAP